MRQLMHSTGFLAHPLGVSHIRFPEPDLTPMLHIDAPASLSRDPLNATMAHNLLPAETPDGDTTGVPGLRIYRVRDQDLTVGMVGATARLTIRAHFRWKPWLTRWADDTNASGRTPLWHCGELTDSEQAEITTEQVRLAWLGSNLLRRIGTFHTLTKAYKVKGWVADGRWMIEMTIAPQLDPRHDELAARLTLPTQGLPLAVVSRSCTCETNEAGACTSRYGCSIDLRPTNPQLQGGLQLRFLMAKPPADWAQKFATVGADPRWLKRTGLRSGPNSAS